MSCSAGGTADAGGTKVGEKAKLDVDSKFVHVSFTVLGFLAWLPGALVLRLRSWLWLFLKWW